MRVTPTRAPRHRPSHIPQVNRLSDSKNSIMSYPILDPLSQAPSRISPPQSLSIRTSMGPNQLATQPAQSSPPSQQQQQQQQAYPIYPLPIPPEKFDRAVTLYGRLKLEEGLAVRAQRHNSSGLNIPKHGRAPSLTSRTSSGPRSPSATASNNGGATDLSSVVSFGENESPSSAVANASTGRIAYNGNVVKQRTRRPLSPTAKAKAALIRHLGSCWVCRSRRVPCPLEHHDIDALGRGLRAKSQRGNQVSRTPSQTRVERAHSTPEPTRPQLVPDGVFRSQSTRAAPSGGFSGQMFSLTGLGQNEELLQTPANAIDHQSPMYDPLLGIQAQPLFRSYDFTQPPTGVPEFNLGDPYANYQNGDMFELGIDVGLGFQCRHLDGLCQEFCSNEEALQLHFESHFSFNRMHPPHRYICSACQQTQCFCGAPIDHLIVGSFIRNQTYQRYSPDGQDHFGRNNSSSDPLSLFTVPNNHGMGPGMGNNGNGNSSMNQGGYYQNNNTFRGQGPSSGHQGSQFGAYDATQQGEFQFHGSDAGEITDMESLPVQSWYKKPIQIFQRNKTAFLVALLFAMTLIIEAHDLCITKARAIRLHLDLPFVGFVTLLVSFVLCHTYWTISDPCSQRDGKTRRRLPKCSLDISSSAISSFQRGTLIRGRVYL